MADSLGRWCIYCRRNVTVQFSQHQWQCYNASHENQVLADEAMDREVRQANVDIQPDTLTGYDSNASGSCGFGLGDSFDEEEQEGDEDMYPLSPIFGEHNFTTNFDDHLDVDQLDQGQSNNSPASWGSLASKSPSEDYNPNSQPIHPPRSTDIMDLFVTDENGEDQNIKCHASSDSYLEEGGPGDYAMFELIRILDSHRCPRIMTGEIINWCKYASHQGCTDPASLPKDRSRFVKKNGRGHAPKRGGHSRIQGELGAIGSD
jgi:hypothetical protein